MDPSSDSIPADSGLGIAMFLQQLPAGRAGELPELPSGFRWTYWQPGLEQDWVALHEVAERFQQVTLNDYSRSFADDHDGLRQRQLYLIHEPDETIVGTATAWYDDDFHGERCGRVHWVAIHPDYQGRGLGRVLVRAVLLKLHELGHTHAYLTTATKRLPAIRLYLSMGFEPDWRREGATSAWESIRSSLPIEFPQPPLTS